MSLLIITLAKKINSAASKEVFLIRKARHNVVYSPLRKNNIQKTGERGDKLPFWKNIE